MVKKPFFSLCVMIILVIIMSGCNGTGNTGGLGDTIPESWTLTIINKTETPVEFACLVGEEETVQSFGPANPGADTDFRVPDQAIVVFYYGDITEGDATKYGKWSQTGNNKSDPVDGNWVVEANGTGPDNYVNTIKNIILVKGSTFQMGNTRNDSEGSGNEKPVHTVNLTYDYYIGKFEVTFNEYDAYCDAMGKTKPDDNGWGRGRHPAINVSWYDAVNYCNWLSEQEGLEPAYDNSGNLLNSNGQGTTDISEVVGYRIPTEAEWEYAARGGHEDITEGVEKNDYKYAGSNSINEVAWNGIYSNFETQEIGEKLPNELGLHDMNGNVSEWAHDGYGSYSSTTQTNPTGPDNATYHVRRGGGWAESKDYCRVPSREYHYPPGSGSYLIGLRIARTRK